MRDLRRCIEELQHQLERHRRSGLKEYPTRTIFIDPLLEALDWDVRDPDDVELERPTIDGKSVDYALKVNRKPVVFLEAKQLMDPLDDVKAITQVVGYASNDGVEWCVLTNGVTYKVFKISERAAAPDKLLFEVSLEPNAGEQLSVDQIASRLSRLSRDSLASGLLDQLGEEIFTTVKVRKALDRLFRDPPTPLLRLVRRALSDQELSPARIRAALTRIWCGGVSEGIKEPPQPSSTSQGKRASRTAKAKDYGEDHHTRGRPTEVVELYRALDRFCQDLGPGQIARRYLAKYITWSIDKRIFCSAHLRQSGLRIWVKLDPGRIPESVAYARDVTNVGHWGVGDLELAVDTIECLRDAQKFIRASFEERQP